MSITTKQSRAPRPSAWRRLWNAPTSPARWFWLLFSGLLYVALLFWYYDALRVQKYPAPFTDPLRLFGIIAFGLVFATASYSLRRRFVRVLPGKVQHWLWMHTWLGIVAILIAFLHENYDHITYNYCQNLSCLTDTYWATGALFALIVLVVSGIGGRLLDFWQAKVIAREASSNGVGIERALEERLRALEYTVERYYAGKSDEFKLACASALASNGRSSLTAANLLPCERSDWQCVQPELQQHARLALSLRRQQRARRIIRVWRSVHIVLACLAMVVISYHGIMELLTNVLHIIKTPA